MKQNPWRKGVAAGREYVRALHAYNASYLAGERDMERPAKPANPYPLGRSKHAGSYQWESGWKDGLRMEESAIRQAKLAERAAARGEKPRLVY